MADDCVKDKTRKRMTKMKAFHGDPKVKETYLARVRAHRLADEVIKGAIDTGKIGTDPVAGIVYGWRGTKTIERGCKNTKGYVVFTLHFMGRRIQAKAHRAIWIAANGAIPEGLVLDHINGMKSDNRIKNLRLVNAKGNAKNRRSYRGSNNPSAKITNKIANLIRSHHSKTKSYTKTAEYFSVSRSLVAQVVRRELWA